MPLRTSHSPPVSASSRASARKKVSSIGNHQPAAGLPITPIPVAKLFTNGARQLPAKRVNARKEMPAFDHADLATRPSNDTHSCPAKIEAVKAESNLSKTESSQPRAQLSGRKQGTSRQKARTEANVSNSADPSKGQTRGVVYLGHIPSGFNEPQMLRFFSQFGEVVGVELRRSRKTGQSKGYGYIGFEVPEVADVVSETMNNYMMFGRTLICQVVPPDRVPPKVFRNWGKKYKRVSTRVRAVQQHNKPENALPSLRQIKRRLQKESTLAKRLKALDLEHDAPTMIDLLSKNSTEQAGTASEAACGGPAMQQQEGDCAKNLRRTLNTLCHVTKTVKKKKMRETKRPRKGVELSRTKAKSMTP